jgi:hypothetical protein
MDFTARAGRTVASPSAGLRFWAATSFLLPIWGFSRASLGPATWPSSGRGLRPVTAGCPCSGLVFAVLSHLLPGGAILLGARASSLGVSSGSPEGWRAAFIVPSVGAIFAVASSPPEPAWQDAWRCSGGAAPADVVALARRTKPYNGPTPQRRRPVGSELHHRYRRSPELCTNLAPSRLAHYPVAIRTPGSHPTSGRHLPRLPGGFQEPIGAREFSGRWRCALHA